MYSMCCLTSRTTITSSSFSLASSITLSKTFFFPLHITMTCNTLHQSVILQPPIKMLDNASRRGSITSIYKLLHSFFCILPSVLTFFTSDITSRCVHQTICIQCISEEVLTFPWPGVVVHSQEFIGRRQFFNFPHSSIVVIDGNLAQK